MSNEYKPIQERIDELCNTLGRQGLNLSFDALKVITTAMKELARDQRHLCAEAVKGNSDGYDGDVYEAVLNARIK